MNITNALLCAICVLALGALPNRARAEYTLQDREYDAIFARARQRERKSAAIIADARQKIMEAKESDEAIVGEMLREIGTVYGWKASQNDAETCARIVLEKSCEWHEANEAVKGHRFNPLLLMIGYPQMWEREHKKLLERKAGIVQTIGENIIESFAIGEFLISPVLKEYFRREGDNVRK